MTEVWKALDAFPDYEVSDQGRVRSPRGILKLVRLGRKDKRTYLYAAPWVNGKRYLKAVHRLVLETFVGPAPEGMLARHDDGDCVNNKLTNLQWGTQIENVADSIRHGTYRLPPVLRGEKNPKAKYSPEDIERMRDLRRYHATYKEIAIWLGIPLPTVGAVLSGRQWA